jgi:hypothetical protein
VLTLACRRRLNAAPEAYVEHRPAKQRLSCCIPADPAGTHTQSECHRRMVSPLVLRLGWSYSEQADTVNPLLCQQAAGAAGKAGCEPVATKSIATMIHGFDRGAVVFFKSSLISY